MTTEERMDRIERKLDLILSQVGNGDRVTTDDIARELGIRSKSIFSARPWLLPNFGVSQYPTRPRSWDRALWETWKETPEELHRRSWSRMKSIQLRKVG